MVFFCSAGIKERRSKAGFAPMLLSGGGIRIYGTKSEPNEWLRFGKEEQGSVRMVFFCSAGIKERRSKADFAPTLWCRRRGSNPHGVATAGF